MSLNFYKKNRSRGLERKTTARIIPDKGEDILVNLGSPEILMGQSQIITSIFVNFGDVKVGTPFIKPVEFQIVKDQLEVSPTGTLYPIEIKISRDQNNENPFSISLLENSGFTDSIIVPSESFSNSQDFKLTLYVQFYPARVSNYSNFISFLTVSGNASVASIIGSGTPVPRTIQINPSSINMGTSNASSPRQVSVTTTGEISTPLSISLTGPGIDASLFQFPATISPQGGVFNLAFNNPGNDTTYDGIILRATADSGQVVSNAVPVTAQGDGSLMPRVTASITRSVISAQIGSSSQFSTINVQWRNLPNSVYTISIIRTSGNATRFPLHSSATTHIITNGTSGSVSFDVQYVPDSIPSSHTSTYTLSLSAVPGSPALSINPSSFVIDGNSVGVLDPAIVTFTGPSGFPDRLSGVDIIDESIEVFLNVSGAVPQTNVSISKSSGSDVANLFTYSPSTYTIPSSGSVVVPITITKTSSFPSLLGTYSISLESTVSNGVVNTTGSREFIARNIPNEPNARATVLINPTVIKAEKTSIPNTIDEIIQISIQGNNFQPNSTVTLSLAPDTPQTTLLYSLTGIPSVSFPVDSNGNIAFTQTNITATIQTQNITSSVVSFQYTGISQNGAPCRFVASSTISVERKLVNIQSASGLTNVPIYGPYWSGFNYTRILWTSEDFNNWPVEVRTYNVRVTCYTTGTVTPSGRLFFNGTDVGTDFSTTLINILNGSLTFRVNTPFNLQIGQIIQGVVICDFNPSNSVFFGTPEFAFPSSIRTDYQYHTIDFGATVQTSSGNSISFRDPGQATRQASTPDFSITGTTSVPATFGQTGRATPYEATLYNLSTGSVFPNAWNTPFVFDLVADRNGGLSFGDGLSSIQPGQQIMIWSGTFFHTSYPTSSAFTVIPRIPNQAEQNNIPRRPDGVNSIGHYLVELGGSFSIRVPRSITMEVTHPSITQGSGTGGGGLDPSKNTVKVQFLNNPSFQSISSYGDEFSSNKTSGSFTISVYRGGMYQLSVLTDGLSDAYTYTITTSDQTGTGHTTSPMFFRLNEHFSSSSTLGTPIVVGEGGLAVFPWQGTPNYRSAQNVNVIPHMILTFIANRSSYLLIQTRPKNINTSPIILDYTVTINVID